MLQGRDCLQWLLVLPSPMPSPCTRHPHPLRAMTPHGSSTTLPERTGRDRGHSSTSSFPKFISFLILALPYWEIVKDQLEGSSSQIGSGQLPGIGSGTPSPTREAVPTTPQDTDPQVHLVLTRAQRFCLLLFLRILSNPDKDLERDVKPDGCEGPGHRGRVQGLDAGKARS